MIPPPAHFCQPYIYYKKYRRFLPKIDNTSVYNVTAIGNPGRLLLPGADCQTSNKKGKGFPLPPCCRSSEWERLQTFGWFVGDAYMRPVHFYPIYRNIRVTAAGGIYAAPTLLPKKELF